MTWWLQQAETPQEITPAVPDFPVASVGEGLTAAYLSANRASNVFNEFESRVADDEASTADEVIKRIGMPGVMDGLRQKSVITPSMEGYGWDFLRYNTDVRRAVLDLGSVAAEGDPDAWKGVDLTTEGAEARVTEAQKKEAQDQAEIIAMSPYPMAESVIGGIGSAVVDPRQWPLMLFNPGGSFLKTVGWQAALGVAGEAVNLPQEIATADRLNAPAKAPPPPPLEPFDHLKYKPRPNADGSVSTEITATTEAPDGGYWNIPTLWWGKDGPVELPVQQAVGLAKRYEASTGRKFPRFANIPDAEASAVARSHGGGASETPLAAPAPADWGQPQNIVPEVNIAERLLMGAAGGAVLGGALEGVIRLPGIVRGLRLHAERVRPIEGASLPQVEPAIAAAEDAITRDVPIEPAIESVMPPADEAPPLADFEAQWREVDAGTDWAKVFQDAQDAATPPDTPDMPQVKPPSWQEDLAQAEKTLAEIAKERKALGRPLTDFVRKKTGGIHPDSQVAEELRAAGITAKSLPGLFTRKASKDLDNLLANEADAAAPGLARVVGGDGTGNYLSRQSVIDNLVSEITGKRLVTDREAELLAMEADAVKTVEAARIEGDIDDAAGKVALTARERDYVRAAMAEGRPADDAVYEAITRQFDEAEAPEVPSDVYQREAEWEPFRDEGAYREASGAGGEGLRDPARPDQNGSASGTGAAGAGPDFAVEATPAGQQTLIPGTEVRARDTSRDRALADLQAKQSKMRRLDQLPPEGMFTPKQMSVFDDPTSPQAAAYVEARVAEMRAGIDPEKPIAVSVMAEDGRILTTTEDVVREIDELDQIEREFAACLLGGVNVGS